MVPPPDPMENRDENERDGQGDQQADRSHEFAADDWHCPEERHTGILRTLSSTSGSINESHHTKNNFLDIALDTTCSIGQSLIFQTNCTQTGSSKLHSMISP